MWREPTRLTSWNMVWTHTPARCPLAILEPLAGQGAPGPQSPAQPVSQEVLTKLLREAWG